MTTESGTPHTPEELKLHKALREERDNLSLLYKEYNQEIKSHKKTHKSLRLALMTMVLLATIASCFAISLKQKSKEIKYQKEIQKQLIINLTTKEV